MPVKQRSHNQKKVILIVIALLAIVLGKFLFEFVQYAPVLFELLFKKEIELKKTNSHINVLLMGIGGGEHEGPQLTDTIIFASIDEDKNVVTMVSLPRDLWIPELESKINTAYARGQANEDGEGLILAKKVVSDVLNKHIDYTIVGDFQGFVKAVDEVGGLDIVADRTFDDYEYPIEQNREDLCGHTLEETTLLISTMSATEVFPCRYQHVHFDKGLQHMDGAKALIFVRSRFAKGEEGTDFARSRRQQKAIQAFKDKIFSLGILLNPVRATKLYSYLAASIHTDVKKYELDDFIKLANKMKNVKITSVVLEIGDEENNKKGLLVNPPMSDFYGAYVLIPRIGSGNFKEIQNYVKCVEEKEVCPIP